MAMNKKEQAEFDAAKKAVVVARALNWSEPVEPDLPPPAPASRQPDTLGFHFNTYNGSICYVRCSSTNHEKDDSAFPERTTSQRSFPIYSTRLLALKALRHAVEKECAEKLARIDLEIIAEKDSK